MDLVEEIKKRLEETGLPVVSVKSGESTLFRVVKRPDGWYIEAPGVQAKVSGPVTPSLVILADALGIEVPEEERKKALRILESVEEHVPDYGVGMRYLLERAGEGLTAGVSPRDLAYLLRDLFFQLGGDEAEEKGMDTQDIWLKAAKRLREEVGDIFSPEEILRGLEEIMAEERELRDPGRIRRALEEAFGSGGRERKE